MWVVNFSWIKNLVQSESLKLVGYLHIKKHHFKKSYQFSRRRNALSYWRMNKFAYEEQWGKRTSVDDLKASDLNTTWHDDRNAKHVQLTTIHFQLKFTLLFCTFEGFSNPYFPCAMPQEIHSIQKVFHRRMAIKDGASKRVCVSKKLNALLNIISTKIEDDYWNWFPLIEGTTYAKPFPYMFGWPFAIENKTINFFQ